MLKESKAFVQYGLLGACRWQVQLDSCFQLNDSGSDFQEFQPDACKGRRGKTGAFEQVRAERMQQDIGRRMQEQAEPVGKEAVAGGTVALGIGLVLLDVEFVIAASAVDQFVKRLWPLPPASRC
jgi:hypothetical protein